MGALSRMLAFLTLATACLAGCSGGGGGAPAAQRQVTGKIVLEGAPLAGATVRLASSSAALETSTGQDGGFAFSVPDGSYRLEAAGPTYSFDPATVFVAGGDVVVPDLTAFRAFTIAGSIARDGMPVAARVALYRVDYTIFTIDGLYTTIDPATSIESVVPDPASRVDQATSADGGYRFAGLRSGSYLVVPTSTSLVFKLAATPTLANSAVITLTDDGQAYFYNPEQTGNQVAGGVIYNSAPRALISQTLPDIDFTAALPAGTRN